MGEEIFIHSRELDLQEVERTGCFTTLPVRIHTRNDIADNATRSMAIEWIDLMADESYIKTNIKSDVKLARLWSAVGDYSSFLYPESLPERLGLMAYLTELAFIHDDIAEEKDFQGAIEEHSDLFNAMDTTNQPIRNLKTAKMKKLLSHAILECVKVDRELGLEVLGRYREGWLAEMDIQNTEVFETLDEYLAFRRLNAGACVLWSMVSYSHGVKFCENDYNIMRDVLEAAERAMLFTNDYFSWHREYDMLKESPGRIVNAIAFLMRKESLPLELAKQRVKNLILEYEDCYVRQRTLLYQTYPKLPFHLRKWAEVCGTIIAGVHFWSANSPRYCSWRIHGEYAVNKILAVTPVQEPCLTEARGILVLPATGSIIDIEGMHMIGNGVRNRTVANGATNGTMREKSQKPAKNVTEETTNGTIDLEKRGNHGIASSLSLSALLAPCNYINSMPSKGVRSDLVDALNLWLRVPDEKLVIIKHVINTLHNSSLILDDIEDNSILRRGRTATHIIFGPAQAINSAIYQFVSVNQIIHRLQNSKMMSSLLEELQSLFLGQSWDLYWKYNLKCPTESEYFAMVDNKTGAMFRMLMSLMQAVTPLGSQYDFGLLAQHLGRFYQIRDDYMNLQSEDYSKQKGFCEDLDEGKFSFPVVYCLNNDLSSRDLVLGIFRQRQLARDSPLAVEIKLQILDVFKKTGVFSETWKVLRRLEEEVEKDIDQIESITSERNPIIRLLLKTLSIPQPINLGSV